MAQMRGTHVQHAHKWLGFSYQVLPAGSTPAETKVALMYSEPSEMFKGAYLVEVHSSRCRPVAKASGVLRKHASVMGWSAGQIRY